MALTLQQLQAQRDKAIMAMASPERVEFQGRGITNRAQRDLQATINSLDAEIAKMQTQPQKHQKRGGKVLRKAAFGG